MIFGDSTSKGITSLFPSPLLMLLLGTDYLKRKKKKKKKENKGITSGLEPVEMISGEPIELKDGGFPDLSGDGKVTQKDILMGRGVIEKADGGIAAYANGGDADSNIFKDYIFDYTDPVDYLTLPLYLAGPFGAAGAKGIKALRTAKKINKKYEPSNVEKVLKSKTVSVGVPSATLATELGTDQEIQDMFNDPEMKEMVELLIEDPSLIPLLLKMMMKIICLMEA